MDAHNQKKKNYKKEKSRYNDLFLVAAVQTPPRQHQKSSFSNSEAFNNAQAPSSPDHRS
jgi:hypothetical protein